MPQYKYIFKDLKENTAKALGRDMPVSFKNAIEICNFLRGKEITKAKNILEKAISMEEAIPFRRFTEGAGHKSGKGAGKFVPKTCMEILKLIKSAESNALDKGLGSNLFIKHIAAQKAGSTFHYGRKRSRKMKRAHIEIVLEERTVSSKPKKEEKKAEAKEETKEILKKTAETKDKKEKTEKKEDNKEGKK
ncbi:50S ribosomal protein L22 [Candidatus Woesearchaeota archaeon]|nr:50S ribosomal protein L22 [Candidatus Woesearchaeota archaeon]